MYVNGRQQPAKMTFFIYKNDENNYSFFNWKKQVEVMTFISS